MSEAHGHGAAPRGRYLAFLALGALGVVYGDIGTSPLYAVREAFHGTHRVATTPDNVLGVLSLIFWALVLIITVKYLLIVMRADNRGEGGILALMALLGPRRHTVRGRGGHLFLMALGLFGAALLYGDGMITPAITVLSAVEGLNIATPFFQPYVIPITIAILVLLFVVQRRGTAGIGAVFGPVMTVWFVVIALLGVAAIMRAPGVLAGINPYYAVEFFVRNRLAGFLVLGDVFLVVTGGEALYADMGHFGRRPIRLAWFGMVLPALLINYFGQGALLMRAPDAAENPFFRLAPTWALLPLVGLATAAAIIASQAVISGAFSLTRQAVQLGYSPRVEVDHTSEREIGQIYIPGINWVLMVACIGLVLGFGSSTNLAAAYGVAVTTTMVITTILLFVVERELWRWKGVVAGLLTTFFLFMDLSFFGANIIKVSDGGWFPLAVAAVVFTLMATWKRGRSLLAESFGMRSLPLDIFLHDIAERHPVRVPGLAVFMTRNADGVPPVMLHHLKHNKVLHEQVVLLSVVTEEIPVVPQEDWLSVEALGEGIFRVVARYGFMEDPNIPDVLAAAAGQGGLTFKLGTTTFYLGRETLLTTKRPGMARWRKRLFALMSRNARSATDYFRIPPNRVVELGAHIEL
ncbi:MAG TPA: potassium transporter Kup [Longimicrobiales bacterium]|nr:potassium transporter Kup [Longimicrobiales bacterium]